MENLIPLAVAIGSLAVGSVLGYLARQSIAKRQVGSVEAKINKLVTEAKTQAQEIILKAKDKAVRALDEIKNEDQRRQEEARRIQRRLEKKEELLDYKDIELKKDEDLFKEKVKKLKHIKEEIQALKEKQIKDLEKVAGLSEAAAKTELLAIVEKEHQEDLFSRIKKLEREGKEELEKKVQDIVTSIMQRYSASQAVELTTTTISLPSDDLKGRIIGKEGRNIKTLERLTGVEVIVDDTPGAIVVSGFDPVRRQIAKLALDKLIADGRIQPARIEEMVEGAREEIDVKVKEAGEAAVYDAGIVGLDPKLIQLLGRLRFRTSFGQNVLLHSLESAHLAGMLASELGADVAVAKKAALLHDIGKAVDHEVQGSHVEIGKRILEKFNIDEKVIKAMQAHHEEYPYETLESIVVRVAEAISAARPGARKDTLENYLKRLEELEGIAVSFEGVEKAYAIQAGREIRIFVTPEKIDDLAAYKLAKDIAKKIEEDLKYPGEIKVNVIRETRAVEYAK